MEQMIGLTDTAFLGRVGEVELGASAIAIVYYMVMFMIGFGFSIGAQIIIGRRNGEGNLRDTGKVFWHGLYFLMGLSGVLITASELFSPRLMDHDLAVGKSKALALGTAGEKERTHAGRHTDADGRNVAFDEVHGIVGGSV